jgi:hypothetical protein
MKKQQIRNYGRILGVLSLLLGISFLGCGPDESSEQARLRAVQFGPSIGRVDVLDDEDLLFDSLEYGDSSSYETLDAGQHQLTVTLDNSFTTLFDRSQSLPRDSDSTLFIFGSPDAADIFLAADLETAPARGRSALRFVNASSEFESVDIYVLSPDQSLQDTVPTFSQTQFEDISDYLDSAEGDYHIQAARSGEKTVLAESDTFHAGSGEIFTAALLERQGGGAPLSLKIFRDKE